MKIIQVKFDSKNIYWTGEREIDLMFLRMVEQSINDFIRIRGYIYLNQIYELLGCEWNPDDRNTCVRSKVLGKPPFVHLSALFEPDGTLSAVDIALYFC